MGASISVILTRNIGGGQSPLLFLLSLAKLGRRWLTKRNCYNMLKLIADKWKHALPGVANPQWKVIWHKYRAHKKVAFLWLVLHKATAVNEWRGQTLVEVDKSFPHCGPLSVGMWNIDSIIAYWRNGCGKMLWTLCDNSMFSASMQGHICPSLCFSVPLIRVYKISLT